MRPLRHCLWSCVKLGCLMLMQGHYLLGLKVLNLLVTEFNQPTTGRTMTQHRKMAVVFRDNALFKIFQIAIAALQLLQTHASADDKLREQVWSTRPMLFTKLEAFPSDSLSTGASSILGAVCRLFPWRCSVCPLILLAPAWTSQQRT